MFICVWVPAWGETHSTPAIQSLEAKDAPEGQTSCFLHASFSYTDRLPPLHGVRVESGAASEDVQTNSERYHRNILKKHD